MVLFLLSLAAALEVLLTGILEWRLRSGKIDPTSLSWLVHLEGVVIAGLVAMAFWKATPTARRVITVLILGSLILVLAWPSPGVTAPRILIEKSRFRLTVYDGQTQRLQIAVGLGPVGGHKVSLNDRRTPVGNYRLCAKEAPQDQVWLGLNYPNADDAWRGRQQGLTTWLETWVILVQNKLGLEPLQRTGLGNGIGIHKGPHFTAGSIGGSPTDLMKLYPLVEIGCPVTIQE